MQNRLIKEWHWVSSALCLIGMLLFSITGITLNHAGWIESQPNISRHESSLPQTELKQLVNASGRQALPTAFLKWYKKNTGQTVSNSAEIEWSEYELYTAMPRPGGDSWFSVNLETGDFYSETTDRGWIAYFNDLHKARNTGLIWSLFIDLFAIASIIFTMTGLLLLKKYSKGRKSTWPLVLAGFIIPLFAIIGSAHAAESELTVEVPRLSVAEYHAPYIAVWLANERQQRVVDIAVWYDLNLANHEGEKWLKDMRQWWRRSGRMADIPIDGVSGATRRPGQHRVDLTPLMHALPDLKAGNYYLYVEAARELGGREVLRLPVSFPINSTISVSEAGKHELGRVSLTLESTP
ncbi:MAG: PepSY-associated TM helix domain-containing protein [Pseudomonadota bacterium]